MSLMDLEEAQERLLALAPSLTTERVPVERARNRVLAADLTANRTQPDADLSAMDGYAIVGDGPWRRIGESRAGKPFEGRLDTGEAVRISTGAALPQGADRVLIQENAQIESSAEGDRIAASETPAAGQHVRLRGFDFTAGATVLEKGALLGPAQIALALAAGHGSLEVKCRPRMAVLDSGDELASDPEKCGPAQIPASNGAMLAAMLAPWIGECERVGPVPDNPDALAAALSRTEEADILITSGGASVGDHDLVQQALVDWGADLAFWKVAIKPGKPLMVASRERDRGRQVILGLPGNPVSSFVTGFLFALPLVRATMGMQRPLPPERKAIAADALPATGPRREFLRGIREGPAVRLAETQDSSALLTLARADCLIARPAEAPSVEAGMEVRVYDL